MGDSDLRRRQREGTATHVDLARAGVPYKVGAITCPHYYLVPKDLRANLRFRRQIMRTAAHDPEAAAQIRTMCAEDLLFYVNTFCWTYDPRSKVKVTPFITYADFQDEAMCEIDNAIEVGQDVATPKSRDMGASWMGLIVVERRWHFFDNLSFLLVSRNEDYVDKRGNPKALFWKIDFLHRHQPRWLLPTDRWKGDRDPNRKLLHLGNADNGSVIDGESTTGDAGRGDRRTAMFIDEHAAFELNDGFKVLRATRDTTNCRIFNSTPQGANNGFYEVVHKTAAKILRLHWSKHPLKGRGLYTTDENTGKPILLDGFRGEVTIRRKGEDPKVVYFPDEYPFELDADHAKLRSPWYDNECARCVSPQEIAQELDIDFLGSDYPFFDQKFIEVYKKRYARPPLGIGNLEYDRETLQPKRFTDHPKGLLHLWIPLSADERPPRDRHYVIGADISAGTGASNSVASVADRETGEKVAVLRTPVMRPHPFAELVVALGRFFNTAYLVWDASGPTGATFTKVILDAGYGNIYYRRYEKKVSRKISDEPGYAMNPQARAAVFEDYRAKLSDHAFINRSAPGLDECLQFIRRPDGGIEHSASANAQDPSGARSAHGDEVVADALCCVGISERRRQEEAEEPGIPVGSLAWRRRQQALEEAKRSQDTLGDGW